MFSHMTNHTYDLFRFSTLYSKRLALDNSPFILSDFSNDRHFFWQNIFLGKSFDNHSLWILLLKISVFDVARKKCC